MRQRRSVSLAACNRDTILASMMSTKPQHLAPSVPKRPRRRGYRHPKTLVLVLALSSQPVIRQVPHPVKFDMDFGAQSNVLRPHKVGTLEFDS